jgi:hypothetical protein
MTELASATIVLLGARADPAGRFMIREVCGMQFRLRTDRTGPARYRSACGISSRAERTAMRLGRAA